MNVPSSLSAAIRDLTAKVFDVMDGLTAVTRGPVGVTAQIPD